MNKTRLNITNGDGAANILKASSIEGDVLAWRDPMHHGPFPANTNLDAMSDIRAEYLAGPGLDLQAVKQSFRTRNEQLRSASRYDEVVLWFEHDLLDQLQILELLNWFNKAHIGSTVLSMVCINKHPDIAKFRGLGQLNEEQLTRLLPTRSEVSRLQMQCATSAWKAFCSDEPRSLERLVNTDISDLPFLEDALRRFFQEYPWVSDHLTRTERQILHTVASGVQQPMQVFVKNMELESVLFIGDWPTYRTIARLCSLDSPLLTCSAGSTFLYPPADDMTSDQFRQQKLSCTDAGLEVLNNASSTSALISRDEWLGGVHLRTGHPLWMWDENASCLVLN